MSDFWNKVDIRAHDECWPWLGTINYAGYGVVRIEGRQHRAHRLAYVLSHETPIGPVLDHLCHTRAVERGECAGGPECRHRRCCNPSHLAVVDQRSNVLRGLAPTSANAAKTHCKNGHEFTPDNTYRTPNGERVCLICRRATGKRYDAKRRAKP